MSRKNTPPVIVLIIILVFLLGGKHWLELDINRMDKQKMRVPVRQVVSSLSQNSSTQAALAAIVVGLGFREVASDFLFLQSIQYFGGRELERKQKFQKLFPIFWSMSYISPHFIPAYSFGALTLQELGYVDKAIQLLNRGISHNPRAFELWLYRDFTIRLFRTKEYRKAIQGIKAALEMEDHPPVLERILAYAYEKNGQIDKAVQQWQKVYTCTEDERIKNICEANIQRLREKK